MPYKVAILGRPNVGKSSLFNCLIEQRKAITDDVSGTTIDRLYGSVSYLGKTFSIIDTGGLEIEKSKFKDEIYMQAQFAIDEANLIIFLTDVLTGITNDDYYIASLINKSKKDVVVCVNKVDNEILNLDSYEFYSLGFSNVIAISTKQRIGIGNLLEYICQKIDNKTDDKDSNYIRFCILGRTNVGKSTLSNAILNQARSIVSDKKGTTRDIIDTPFKRNKKDYLVIDTAGILRPGGLYTNLEKYAQIRSLDAIMRSDVAILLLDATEPITELDKNIAGYIKENNKAVVVCVNKWDLVEKENNTTKKFLEKIRENFKMFQYADVVFISAKEKEKINDLFNAIDRAYESYHLKFKTSILNQILAKAITVNPAKIFNNGQARFKYITQISIAPPRFNLFVNNKEYVHFSYLRYLENEFRNSLNLVGTPIVFEVVEGEKDE